MLCARVTEMAIWKNPTGYWSDQQRERLCRDRTMGEQVNIVVVVARATSLVTPSAPADCLAAASNDAFIMATDWDASLFEIRGGRSMLAGHCAPYTYIYTYKPIYIPILTAGPDTHTHTIMTPVQKHKMTWRSSHAHPMPVPGGRIIKMPVISLSFQSLASSSGH